MSLNDQIILLTVDEQLEEWQKHYKCPCDTDTAEEVEVACYRTNEYPMLAKTFV